MKATLIGLVLLVSVAGCGTRQAPLATRQDRFINVIRVLADSGRLTDRQEVERLLGTKLIEKWRFDTSLPSPEQCEGQSNKGKTQKSVVYRADANFWFKGTLADSHLEPLNSSHKEQDYQNLNSPFFYFSITHKPSCSNQLEYLSPLSASVNFQLLESFICTTREQLKSALPQVKRTFSTDGAQPYFYEGNEADTWVVFNFQFGNKCMTRLAIEQGPKIRESLAELRAKKI